MSSITELRKQIRQVTADFQEQIASLTEQLAEIQPLEISQKERKMNFSRLERVSAKRAFEEHPLKNEDEDTRHRYLMFLCAVAQTSTYMDDAWVFIQRIASGAGVGSLERCAADAMQLSVDDVEQAADAFAKHGLGEMFLLDAMLVYLACGEKQTEQAKELILDLAALLKQQPEDIERLVNRARAAAEDEQGYQKEQKKELMIAVFKQIDPLR